MRTEKQTFEFTKMQGCGNDYIYFNCFDQRIDNPEVWHLICLTDTSVSAVTVLSLFAVQRSQTLR